MVYQLSMVTASTYMLGDTLSVFSILSGVFLFFMGVGAYYFKKSKNKYQSLESIYTFLVVFGICGLIGLFFIYAETFKSNVITVWMVWIVALVLQCILGFLAGGILPLTNACMDFSKDKSNALSKVLSFDYLGSFLGAFLFPIWFLPVWGLFQTIYLCALINLLNLTVYVVVLKRITFLKISCIAVLSIISVSLFIHSSKIEDRLDSVIYEK